MLSLWLVATYLRPVPMETYGAPGPSAALVEDQEGTDGVTRIESLTEAN